MLERSLHEALRGSPLAPGLEQNAGTLLEEPDARDLAEDLDPALCAGLARACATSAETARFLAHRAPLREQLRALGPDYLEQRIATLASPLPVDASDLEGLLDGMRLLRRQEMVLAAVLDLGHLVPFESISRFLSHLAEAIVRMALAAAQTSAGRDVPLAVVSMGKLGGREFTYHSDLDLVFLFDGGPERMTDASRVVQRLIAYLTTMTGAGVAYAVDTRLRPSGQQGTLVTSFDAFTGYQERNAETWEHLTVVRARPIAGAVEPAARALAHVRERVLGSDAPWAYAREMRDRVERERAADRDVVHLKTGRGGLMDLDFLAEGGVLERGPDAWPDCPAVPDLLRASVRGPRVEALLEDYAFLRQVEARARWAAGKPVETLPRGGEEAVIVADLVEPGLSPAALLDRLEATCERIRGCFDDVVSAGRITALEAPG